MKLGVRCAALTPTLSRVREREQTAPTCPLSRLSERLTFSLSRERERVGVRVVG
jgi:hypothetical protein